MSLTQTNLKRIEWKDPCTKGKLYRGHSQGMFEYRVLESVLRYMRPSYWGYNKDDNGRITFCETRYNDGLFYAGYWAKRYDLNHLRSFTHFPIIFEINAEKYKKRMYKSTEGEGIVIKGPIDLKDITILYALGVDILEQRYSALAAASKDSATQEETRISTEILKSIKDSKRKIESACAGGEFSTESLVSRFEKDRENVLEELCGSFWRKDRKMGLVPMIEDYAARKKLIIEGMNVLKEKFGQS